MAALLLNHDDSQLQTSVPILGTVDPWQGNNAKTGTEQRSTFYT
jgi:hypothetical protein